MVQFKYKTPERDINVIQDNFPSNNPYVLIGWMDEGTVNQLRHYSLYIVSEHEGTDNAYILVNPICIVAKNDTEAMNYYNQIYPDRNGYIFGTIEDRCDKLKVEPV